LVNLEIRVGHDEVAEYSGPLKTLRLSRSVEESRCLRRVDNRLPVGTA